MSVGKNSKQGPKRPEKIKICFFSSIASFETGMPICTYALISHFAANPAYEVHAVFPEAGEFVARLENINVPVAVIPFVRLRSPARGAEFIRFLAGLYGAVRRISRFMREKGFTLVHFSDFIDAPFYPCAKSAKAVVVAHLRWNIEHPLMRLFFRWWTVLFTHRVVCISDSVKHHAGGLPDDKTTVVYDPGPDRRLFDPKAAYPFHPVLDKSKLAIVTIAKFLEIKGHEHFIRMAACAEQALPGRLQYIIVGGRQEGHERYYEKMIRLIGDCRLSQSIAVIARVPHEEIPALLSHTAVFVHLPKCQEGLGGVILEAMAMAVPVVAFDSGGVRECFRDGEHGFLIKQYDVSGAAKKVVLLASDEALRRKMGEAGRVHVGNVFSYEKHFSGIETVYKSLLSTK